MIPLPNDLWLRSPKMPTYAICFDPADRFFLWKMVENPAYDSWTSVSALSAEDLVKILDIKDPSLDPFRPALQKRLEEIHAHIRADQERGARVLRDTYGVRP